MYGGGLFGDLPAAKSSEDVEAVADINSSNTTTNKNDGTTQEGKSSAVTTKSHMLFAPPSKKKASKKSGTSIAKAIGSAGTSMAFIPAAARKRKIAPKSAAAAIKMENDTSEPPMQATHEHAQSLPAAVAIKQEKPSSLSVDPAASTFTTSYTTTTPDTSSSSLSNTDIHGMKLIELQDTLCDENEIDIGEASRYDDPEEGGDQHQHQQQQIAAEDLYDPYVPNDLLQYWERHRLEQHRQEQEQEIRETLERQEVLRQRLEQERQQILSSTPIKTEAEVAPPVPRSGMGRGRGRGLSNLPAWLVAKQRKEEQAAEIKIPVELVASGMGRGRGRGLSNLPAWLVEKQRKEAAEALLRDS